jgi:DNA replication protein DnaC
VLNHPTLNTLRKLQLNGMAEALIEQFNLPMSDVDFESRLAMLVEREWCIRENRRLKRRLIAAKLQQAACIENIDFQHPRGLHKAQILELSQCHWVKNHLGVLITGPTGFGRTFLA